MGEFFDQIPDKVQPHIKEITKTSGLGDDDALEKIAEGWLEKKKTFEEEIRNLGMVEVDSFSRDDERGCLAMTYSGSLVNIGPLVDGVRKSAYASIGLRKDVPDMVSKDSSTLDNDIQVDDSISFTDGPVKKTSPIYKIIVCEEDLSAEEQEEKIENVATVIIDDFVEVNKTIID